MGLDSKSSPSAVEVVSLRLLLNMQRAKGMPLGCMQSQRSREPFFAPRVVENEASPLISRGVYSEDGDSSLRHQLQASDSGVRPYGA